MAGRTRADATLMGTWGEGGGGERLGVTKGSERDGAIELESILHIIALSVFSRREVAIAVFAACGVVWRVCVCVWQSVHMFLRTHTFFYPPPFVPGRNQWREQQDAAEKRVVNHFSASEALKV